MTESREASSIASATSSGELLGATKITATAHAARRPAVGSGDRTPPPTRRPRTPRSPPSRSSASPGSETTTRAVRSHLWSTASETATGELHARGHAKVGGKRLESARAPARRRPPRAGTPDPDSPSRRSRVPRRWSDRAGPPPAPRCRRRRTARRRGSPSGSTPSGTTMRPAGRLRDAVAQQVPLDLRRGRRSRGAAAEHGSRRPACGASPGMPPAEAHGVKTSRRTRALATASASDALPGMDVDDVEIAGRQRGAVRGAAAPPRSAEGPPRRGRCAWSPRHGAGPRRGRGPGSGPPPRLRASASPRASRSTRRSSRPRSGRKLDATSATLMIRARR